METQICGIVIVPVLLLFGAEIPSNHHYRCKYHAISALHLFYEVIVIS